MGGYWLQTSQLKTGQKVVLVAAVVSEHIHNTKYSYHLKEPTNKHTTQNATKNNTLSKHNYLKNLRTLTY